MNQNRSEFNLGSALFQNIFGLIRVGLVFFILIFFAHNYSVAFHQISPLDLATDLQKNPVFTHWNPAILGFIGSLLDPYVFRYAIAPLAAMICIILAGA